MHGNVLSVSVCMYGGVEHDALEWPWGGQAWVWEEDQLGPVEEVAIRLLIRIYVYGLGFLDSWFRDYASA